MTESAAITLCQIRKTEFFFIFWIVFNVPMSAFQERLSGESTRCNKQATGRGTDGFGRTSKSLS